MPSAADGNAAVAVAAAAVPAPGPPASRPGRLRRRRERHRHLLRGWAWLTLALGANALGGFVFWLVAARLVDVEIVGRATALFTGALFVNYLTSLGLPIALARHAADRSSRASGLFTLGAAASAVASIAGATMFVTAAPQDMTRALTAHGWLAGWSVFSVCAVGMALAVLVEVRLMALRRGGWVLARAAVVAAVRLPLLAVAAVRDDPFWLFAAVAVPVALSGFAGAAALLSVRGTGLRSPGLAPAFRQATGYAAVNWLGLLAAQGPQFALPLIVAAHVAPDVNAVFYLAWSITVIAFLVPHTLGQVLLIEGGRGGADLRSQVRLTLGLGLVAMAAAAVISVAGRDGVTAVYGQAYAGAARVLPVLLLACIPWVVTSSLLARVRVEGRAVATVVITTTFAAAVLIPAAVLTAAHGIDGATQAWLLGNLVASVVAVAVAHRPAALPPPARAGRS